MSEDRPRLIDIGYVMNPEKDLVPDYKISPFSTADIAKNLALPDADSSDRYFYGRFGHKRIIYTINGRAAINIALRSYNLSRQDCVTIHTTSGNHYISSCVTAEIDKFCGWSMKLESNTKVLFVNHEFGFPYQGIGKLKESGLPIIEDCAHSFFSQDAARSIGKVGEFTILSFPKMFPIQIGGLLVTNDIHRWEQVKQVKTVSKPELNYIKKVISFHLPNSIRIIDQRLRNYKDFIRLLAPLGVTERFPLKRGVVPGVFLFNIPIEHCLLPALKTYLYKHGIQCSVFYGENAFYIPVHQNMEIEDLEYIKEIIATFVSLLCSPEKA